MPFAPHEVASDKIRGLIQATLKQHQCDSTWGPFLREVYFRGCTQVNLDNRTNRQPDQSWKHKSAQMPGVVVEVQSTRREDPAKQAYDWIVRSTRNVKVLIIVILSITQGDHLITVQTWKQHQRGHFNTKRLESENVGLFFIACEFNMD